MTEQFSPTPLSARERNISAELLTSANTEFSCNTIFGIPPEVAGMTIVDLGGGASPLTATLANRGAHAFAVDQLYGDPQALQENVNRSFPIIVFEQTPPQYQQVMYAKTVEAIDTFHYSYMHDSGRYIGARFTQLPFKDDVADMTVSLHAISDMAADPEVFEAAVREGIRITKPGGKFVMAPYHVKKGVSSKYRDEHSDLYNKLVKLNLGQVSIEKVKHPQVFNPRLVVVKR